MLTPKKTIPSLAAATLALTGTACGGTDSGGTGGSGGSGGDLASTVSQFCMRIVECFPDENLQDCIGYYDYLFSDGDAACQAAAISYFDCGLTLPCDQLGLESNACDPEFNNANNVCFG